jgi:rubrerythrin
MVGLIKFLTACALVEESLANIYREMAAASAMKDRELSAIWMEMARDEEDHAQQLRMAARLTRDNAFDAEASKIDIDPSVLTSRANAFLEQIVSGQLTESDMLRIALELEEEFSRLHATSALAFRDGSLKEMFKAMARAEDKHTASLIARVEGMSRSKG